MYSYDLSVFKSLLLAQLIGREIHVNMVGQHNLVTSVKWMQKQMTSYRAWARVLCLLVTTMSHTGFMTQVAIEHDFS